MRSRALALALWAALLGAACSSEEREVLPFEGGDVALAPGTYANEGFRPAFTFALGSGWRGGHQVPNEFFDVIADDVTVGFARPVFVMGAGEERIDVAGMDPDGVIDALADHPAVDAALLPETTIDGRAAPTVELTPRNDIDLFGSAAGEFGAGAGKRHRISAVVLDDALVLVLAIVSEGPFDPSFARAQTVIASIET